jgi:hypothetical protein
VEGGGRELRADSLQSTGSERRKRREIVPLGGHPDREKKDEEPI